MDREPVKIKRLKVYQGHHGDAYAPHPFIRLSGKYLSRFGFEIGDRVEVALETGRIIIVKTGQKQLQST